MYKSADVHPPSKIISYMLSHSTTNNIQEKMDSTLHKKHSQDDATAKKKKRCRLVTVGDYVKHLA